MAPRGLRHTALPQGVTIYGNDTGEVSVSVSRGIVLLRIEMGDGILSFGGSKGMTAAGNNISFDFTADSHPLEPEPPSGSAKEPNLLRALGREFQIKVLAGAIVRLVRILPWKVLGQRAVAATIWLLCTPAVGG